MKKDGRYDVSGLPEAQFEPGSDEQVLKNRRGIKSPKEMDDVETRALEKTMGALVREYDENHRFMGVDVCGFHKAWLGEIYDGETLHRDYRAEPCGFLTSCVVSLSVSVRAMDSAGVPVSIEDELETFVINAFRNFFGSRR